MRNRDYLDKKYSKNQENGHYVVEITADSYKDIFNDLDSAPFKKRDLNPDLESFLHNCSIDIPFKYKIDLCFHVSKEDKNSKHEKLIISGIKTHYSFYCNSKNQYLRECYQKIIAYILVSFGLLFLGFFFENSLSKTVFSKTILEGMSIGGWVFLWEAISFSFLNNRKKISDEIKECDRFYNSNIYFKYGDSEICE